MRHLRTRKKQSIAKPTIGTPTETMAIGVEGLYRAGTESSVEIPEAAEFSVGTAEEPAVKKVDATSPWYVGRTCDGGTVAVHPS